MGAIKLSGWVRADRKLLLELPANTPLGLVDILILPKKDTQPTIASVQPASWADQLKQLRKQLRSGRTRKRIHSTPPGYVPLNDEERMALLKLPAGVPLTDVLVDEDRGPR